MPAQFIGAHMPTAGGLDKAIRRGKAIGCTAVQVFTSSPQQWKSKEVTPEAIAAFKTAVEETGINKLASHDSYLVNLSAPTEEQRAKSIDGLKGEMRRCGAYGIPLVVSHIGAHMGQGEEMGLELAAQGIREVLSDTPEDVTLLIETTAGQGSSLFCTFEHIAKTIDLCNGEQRLGVCLDTCHLFAAGYDLKTPEGYDSTFETLDRIIGFERVKAVHCNDSKKGLSSHVDRHAHIGEGELGEAVFKRLVNDPRFELIPIVLETPDAETMHEVNLSKLLSYRQ